MTRKQALQYISYIADDSLNVRAPKSITPADTRERGTGYKHRSVLVGWQCGFEPLFVAVHSYLDVELDDQDAEEIAQEYLAERNWFAGEPTEADYIIR